MARSSYVYVVLGDDGPLAGFTVKHELVTWLNRESSWVRRSFLDFIEIWRLPDNSFPGRKPVKMYPETNSEGYVTAVRD